MAAHAAHTRRGGTLQLRVAGEDTLARWALERRVAHGAFARAFGRRLAA